MKKILFSFVGICIALLTHAQVLLNEFYVRPSENKNYNEYFELYNPLPSAQSLNSYTLITYYQNSSSDQGFYVINFPSDATIGPNGFYVGSSALNFKYQAQNASSGTANLNWNDGHITKYQFVSKGNFTAVSGAQNDIFLKSNGSSGVYAVFLYNNGSLVDYFLGASNSLSLPSFILDKTDNTHPFTPAVNPGVTPLSIDFNSIAVPSSDEKTFNHVVSEAGTDNGYSRLCAPKSNGRRSFWQKTSSVKDNTPGAFNPDQSASNDPSDIEADVNCASGTFMATITSASGNTDLFPANYYLYQDNLPAGLGPEDQLLASGSVPSDGYTITTNVPNTDFAYVLVIEPEGVCSSSAIFPGICAGNIVTPVTLSAFNAQRSGANVLINWNTASESNNKGFYIQRKTGSGEWTSITFVDSKAPNGSSTVELSYHFTDVNPATGVTQYRLLQTDRDGKSQYSPIRSVEGIDQQARLLVFPNPSSNGIVNVVFGDNAAGRNVVISDMVGRVLRQWIGVSANSMQIDNLQPGIYNIRVINVQTGKQNVERVIVNR